MLAMNRDPMVLGSIVSYLAELFLSALVRQGWRHKRHGGFCLDMPERGACRASVKQSRADATRQSNLCSQARLLNARLQGAAAGGQ